MALSNLDGKNSTRHGDLHRFFGSRCSNNTTYLWPQLAMATKETCRIIEISGAVSTDRGSLLWQTKLECFSSPKTSDFGLFGSRDSALCYCCRLKQTSLFLCGHCRRVWFGFGRVRAVLSLRDPPQNDFCARVNTPQIHVLIKRGLRESVREN